MKEPTMTDPRKTPAPEATTGHGSEAGTGRSAREGCEPGGTIGRRGLLAGMGALAGGQLLLCPAPAQAQRATVAPPATVGAKAAKAAQPGQKSMHSAPERGVDVVLTSRSE